MGPDFSAERQKPEVDPVGQWGQTSLGRDKYGWHLRRRVFFNLRGGVAPLRSR